MQPSGGPRGAVRTRRVAGAVLAGALIAPAIGVLLLGFAPGAAVAALLVLALTLLGVRGGVLAVLRWRRAGLAERAGEGVRTADVGATAFAAPAQRASSALAVLVLVLGALTALGWAAATARPPTGPVDGFDDVLVPALGALALGACVVPVLLAQAAWTRAGSGVPEAEAAVLARRLPGPRRLVLAARSTALVAWALAAVAGAVVSVLLVQSTVRQAVAVTTAYSQREVSSSTRMELTGDGFLVAGVRCPRTAPLLHEATLTCTLTTLGRPGSVEVRWRPALSGVGGTQVIERSTGHLTRASDLPGPPPRTAVVDRDVSRRAMQDAVRAAIAAAGFDLRDPRLSRISCPGVGRGYDGFVRCDLGTGYDARSLDVYPDGSTVRPRLEELADLRS